MKNVSESAKVVQLSSVKLENFLKALAEIGRDEYRHHLANTIYDDPCKNIEANDLAKQALCENRAG